MVEFILLALLFGNVEIQTFSTMILIVKVLFRTILFMQGIVH